MTELLKELLCRVDEQGWGVRDGLRALCMLSTSQECLPIRLILHLPFSHCTLLYLQSSVAVSYTGSFLSLPDHVETLLEIPFDEFSS